MLLCSFVGILLPPATSSHELVYTWQTHKPKPIAVPTLEKTSVCKKSLSQAWGHFSHCTETLPGSGQMQPCWQSLASCKARGAAGPRSPRNLRVELPALARLPRMGWEVLPGPAPQPHSWLPTDGGNEAEVHRLVQAALSCVR